ncbi:unnamed protein product [Caenorhabditis auriculariae]|uniref:WD repeat-containing protein 37 n=1 Tax=Caenorhabditis auriculariae TaxID=2777116 RepID=A0A8S1HQA5_9PELO|nr:unnamed protein product [Caenorhabditis auriculariae]
MPQVHATPEISKTMRTRSSTDVDNTCTPAVSQNFFTQSTSIDVDDAPFRARLYQLFGLIEKEFDSLYAENCALRARIAQLSENDGDTCTLATEHFSGQDFVKGSGGSKKAMQMGQKLRTAFRGPPARLVFKTDGSRFRLTRQVDGHRDGVWHVTTDVPRNIFASASADQTARVWSLDSGLCIGTYSGHSGSVNCVAISPASDAGGSLVLATSSGDESTHIWKLSLSGTVHTSSEEEDEDKEVYEQSDRQNPSDSHERAPHSEGFRIRVPQYRLTGHRAPVVCCDWLSGGQKLISASWDKTANIYDVEKGEVINILSGHEQELNNCCSHVNQKLVATSSKDTTFRLWDFRDSIQSVSVFQGHQDSVTSVAFSSGDRIVSASEDRTVKVWDLRNMRSSLSTIRLSAAANRVAVSKAHGVIAVPMDNRHVRIYDLSGNLLPRVPKRRCHSRMVTCAAWADDHPQNNLITAGFDRLVATWRVAISKDN